MSGSLPRRPFYAEYAWAFDLLIDRPVRKECAAIVDWLTQRRVLPGADLLDDVLDDRERERVFAAFARSLRASGVLIFDVRECEATATRKIREPLFRKPVATDRLVIVARRARN